jgi:hypothetical protein
VHDRAPAGCTDQSGPTNQAEPLNAAIDQAVVNLRTAVEAILRQPG